MSILFALNAGFTNASTMSLSARIAAVAATIPGVVPCDTATIPATMAIRCCRKLKRLANWKHQSGRHRLSGV